jgi:hypothetical protein
MAWSDYDRPKSAKMRLLEAAWREVARADPNKPAEDRELTPQERLAHLHREQRQKRRTVKELAAIWLEFQRTGKYPEGF